MATCKGVTAYLVVFGALACLGQQNEIGQKGRVVLNVTDTFGNPLHPTEIRVISTSGTEVTLNGTGETLNDLPYGDYKLRILVPGFSYWNGDLHLSTPQVRLTVGMVLGTYEGPKPTCALLGQVVGINQAIAAPVWIRLLPIFAREPFEADTANGGQFRIAGVDCGLYVLAVLQGPKVIQTTLLDLRGDTKPISIRITR